MNEIAALAQPQGPHRAMVGLARLGLNAAACLIEFRYRARAVLGRAGFHRLPGLGAGAVRARRDRRLRLRPAPRGRDARCGRASARRIDGAARRMGGAARRRPRDHARCAGRDLGNRADPRHGDRDGRRTACRTRSCPGATWSSSLSPARWPTGAAPSTSSPACARPIISGYPDCRDDTIKAMARALNLGMERDFVVHTPLMWVDKAATFRMAEEIGGAARCLI